MNDRINDLVITVLGFIFAHLFWWGNILTDFPEWIFKWGVNGSLLIMLMYFLRFKLAAEGVDPDSKPAFKEYLKFGSLYCFILFLMDLPVMLAVL
jgi:steroid 5-alpha reductase family enzyme